MNCPMAKYPAPGAYVRAWRRGKAITAAGGTIRFDWCSPTLDGPAFTREMRAALDRRINERGGIAQTGRKHDDLWQANCRRDARAINAHCGRRVALRLCNLSTREIRRRYAGRIPADYSGD